MQTFSLTITSKLHYNIILTVLTFPTILIATQVIPKGSNKIVIVACFIILLTVFALIAEKYSRQQVELTIRETLLQIDWIKLPIYQKKEDKKILWNEIENHKYEKGKDFNTFTINLTDGQRFSFTISRSGDLKPFDDFYQIFAEKVETNKSQIDSA